MIQQKRYWLIALFLLIADQASKAWATAKLKPVGVMEVWPEVFRFSYALNRGVAFSLFADVQFNIKWVLAAVSGVAAVLVMYYLSRTPRNERLMSFSLALLLSGILGNLIDRVRLGEVVDFIEFHWRDMFIWPTFNIADAAICIGAVLLGFVLMREEKAERARQQSVLTESPVEESNIELAE
jgi:signal peptidase II